MLEQRFLHCAMLFPGLLIKLNNYGMLPFLSMSGIRYCLGKLQGIEGIHGISPPCSQFDEPALKTIEPRSDMFDNYAGHLEVKECQSLNP